jgi:hypothetical protein
MDIIHEYPENYEGGVSHRKNEEDHFATISYPSFVFIEPVFHQKTDTEHR